VIRPGHEETCARRREAVSRVLLVARYVGGRFPQFYEELKGLGVEGVVLKRRLSFHARLNRDGVESRDWLKRRFAWD
jgi:hypothetical protein